MNTTKPIIAAIFLFFLSITYNSNASSTHDCEVLTYSNTEKKPHIKIQTSRIKDTPLLKIGRTLNFQSNTCFTISNATNEEQQLDLYMENPRVTHIELTELEGTQQNTHIVAGMQYPLSLWKTYGAEVIFKTSVPARAQKTFNLKIESIFSYNSNLQINSDQDTFNTLILQQSIAGVIAGFILSIVIYTLLLGFATKDATYFYLFFSAGSVTLLQLNDMGLLYPFWPNSPYWNIVSSGMFAILSTIGGIGVGRSYLMTQNNTPKTDRFLRMAFWYTTIVALPMPLTQNDNLFLLFYALPAVLIIIPGLIISSIIRIRQGYTPAKLYLLALSTPVFAGTLIFLMYTGIMPTSQLTRVLPLLGTMAQLIIFGLAIGEKISWLRDQKNKSNNIVLQVKTETDAKKNFLAHVSHELRSPLAGIIGLAELAKANPIYPDNKPLIDGIKTSAESLLSAVNVLLDHARLDSGKWRVSNSIFSIKQLLQDITAHQKKVALRKKITINTHFDDQLPNAITADKQVIRKIIDCIFEHSIDNMNTGNILLKAESSLLKQQGQLRIDIIDTGDGVPDNYKSRIFQVFELQDASSTRQQQGIGASLALAKKLCTLLGGELGYDSNPLHGTAFWCHIPFLPATDSEPPSPSLPTSVNTTILSEPPPLKPNADVILVAEDDDVLRLVIASQLEKLGKTHHLYPNGKPLTDYYIAKHTSVAMVLLDWNMPICNAQQAIAIIRQHESFKNLPAVPIAILSAHDSNSAKELSFPKDVYFLQKPFTIDDLQKLLSTHQPQ